MVENSQFNGIRSMNLPDLKEPDYWALNKLFSLAIDFMQLLQMDIF